MKAISYMVKNREMELTHITKARSTKEHTPKEYVKDMGLYIMALGRLPRKVR